MKLSEQINFSTNFNNYIEDDDIIIDFDKKTNIKECFDKIKNNYFKYGVDFVKNMDPIYSMYLYDKKKKILIIIADMVGLNPIFYHIKDNSIYIGNDIIELMNKFNLRKEINKHSLSIYFKYHYINSPDTIFSNTYKLKHGKYLIFQDGNVEIKSYWNIGEKFNTRKIIKSYDECKKELDDKLNNYIKK